MRISQDKIEFLEKLKPGTAFVLFGEAGTGKTLMGLLCGKQLLSGFGSWQKILYLTYSKLAKRQILETMRKLREEGMLEDEFATRMDVLNYHSLWWDLICKHYSFLGISSKPQLSTLREAEERAELALREAEQLRIVPKYFIRKSDGGLDQRRKEKLMAAIVGAAVVYKRWDAKHFGVNAKDFIGQDAFLSWAESKILTWNRKGLFWHDETVSWAYQLLTKHPNALSLIKAHYPALIIDEFQDTDIVQWKMVKLLIPETIIVMADPAQTIHYWRGANPNRIEHLIEHCKKSAKFSSVDEVKLTEKHRTKRNMSDRNNISWINVHAGAGPDELAKLTNKAKMKCKGIILDRLKTLGEKTIAILCLTNELADDITGYLRQTNKFQTRGRMTPIECARLGVENSPYEKGREIIIRLSQMLTKKPISAEDLQDYLANQLLAELLPLSKSSLPNCSAGSRNRKHVKRWNDAGSGAGVLSEDFGSGLIQLCQYIRNQASNYECRCDSYTAHCIGYMGRAIHRMGRRTWVGLSAEGKRRKIDAVILQYESASAAKRSERVAVMTVHQSKSREFNIVIIPWFSRVGWGKGHTNGWDTGQPETVNVFHTACTRAIDEVIVICPKSYEANWPPETSCKF